MLLGFVLMLQMILCCNNLPLLKTPSHFSTSQESNTNGLKLIQQECPICRLPLLSETSSSELISNYDTLTPISSDFLIACTVDECKRLFHLRCVVGLQCIVDPLQECNHIIDRAVFQCPCCHIEERFLASDVADQISLFAHKNYKNAAESLKEVSVMLDRHVLKLLPLIQVYGKLSVDKLLANIKKEKHPLRKYFITNLEFFFLTCEWPSNSRTALASIISFLKANKIIQHMNLGPMYKRIGRQMEYHKKSRKELESIMQEITENITAQNHSILKYICSGFLPAYFSVRPKLERPEAHKFFEKVILSTSSSILLSYDASQILYENIPSLKFLVEIFFNKLADTANYRSIIESNSLEHSLSFILRVAEQQFIDKPFLLFEQISILFFECLKHHPRERLHGHIVSEFDYKNYFYRILCKETKNSESNQTVKDKNSVAATNAFSCLDDSDDTPEYITKRKTPLPINFNLRNNIRMWGKEAQDLFDSMKQSALGDCSDARNLHILDAVLTKLVGFMVLKKAIYKVRILKILAELEYENALHNSFRNYRFIRAFVEKFICASAVTTLDLVNRLYKNKMHKEIGLIFRHCMRTDYLDLFREIHAETEFERLLIDSISTENFLTKEKKEYACSVFAGHHSWHNLPEKMYRMKCEAFIIKGKYLEEQDIFQWCEEYNFIAALKQLESEHPFLLPAVIWYFPQLLKYLDMEQSNEVYFNFKVSNISWLCLLAGDCGIDVCEILDRLLLASRPYEFINTWIAHLKDEQKTQVLKHVWKHLEELSESSTECLNKKELEKYCKEYINFSRAFRDLKRGIMEQPFLYRNGCYTNHLEILEIFDQLNHKSSPYIELITFGHSLMEELKLKHNKILRQMHRITFIPRDVICWIAKDGGLRK
ncbi:hypothetical protein ENBRE01_0307 [Enteropsectra breve]|nr:hypothetical protein ENBRE01_0307 [Enteropsectra breve]